MRHFLRFSLLVLGLTFVMPFASAEDGVSSSTIVIGQSVSLSGSTGSLGEEMRQGALAYFEQINRQGGVNGRRIVLKTMDDAYDVNRTTANVKHLIENDKVFALFGLRGTAHTNAAAKIFTPAKVPLVGTFSGAQSLREPFNRYIFHARASYAEETERLITQITSLGMKKIAVFYQNDGYGKEGRAAAEAAVKRHSLELVAVGTVEPNSSDVNSAVDAIAKIEPQAVIMYANYKASAAFVRKMHAIKAYPQFMSLSIVDTSALARELGNEARGIGISQVVPYPFSISTQITKEYQFAMKALSEKTGYSFISLESYIDAKILVEALRRAGKDITREKLITALESMTRYDIGGYVLSYSANNHEGSKLVDLTVIGIDGKILR